MNNDFHRDNPSDCNGISLPCGKHLGFPILMWEYDDALFLIETFSTGIYYCIVGFAWCNCRSRGTMFLMTLSHGENWDKGFSHQICQIDWIANLWLNRLSFTHSQATWVWILWSSAFPYFPGPQIMIGIHQAAFLGFTGLDRFPRSCFLMLNSSPVRWAGCSRNICWPDHEGRDDTLW